MTTPVVTLKPCPFCGGGAMLLGNMGQPAEHWYVVCRDCDVESDANTTSQDEAVTAWNQPATTADLQARLEACEAAVNALCRVLGPVAMTLAQQECIGEPLPREAVILSFMGSGASDNVTVGEFDDAMGLARQALSTTRNADAKGGADEAASHAFNERDAWADIDDRHRAEGL